METEWTMQERLTQEWIDQGLTIDGNKLLLVAWEVMVDSWEINDSQKRWNEPSVDFLFLGQEGNIWILEMKRWIKSLRDAWNTLCQVTHRAIELRKNFSFNNINSVFKAAFQGNTGVQYKL